MSRPASSPKRGGSRALPQVLAEPQTRPVWVWLPGDPHPVQAGRFTLTGGPKPVGTFAYDPAYLAQPGRVALDPLNMPLTARTFREVRQGGLFGAFRDACPDGFSLEMLERRYAGRLLSPLDVLELSPGDAVGGIEVCADVATKMRVGSIASVDKLKQMLAANPDGSLRRVVASMVYSVNSSLGGERPKITVMHKGQMWIAKMRAAGDHALGPLHEYVAMRLARECDINAAEVEFIEPGNHPVLLVKRFDRLVTGHGHVLRSLFLSAHSLLRLDTPTRDDRSRSYVALCHELVRVCARQGRPAAPLQRELFRRMVFNAACCNGDDHPRNHGLLHDGQHWGLSPAFDIAPHPLYNGTQAMTVNRDGTFIAGRQAFLRSCELFGYEKGEASGYIDFCLDKIATRWPEIMEEAGHAEQEVLRPAWPGEDV